MELSIRFSYNSRLAAKVNFELMTVYHSIGLQNKGQEIVPLSIHFPNVIALIDVNHEQILSLCTKERIYNQII